jgi:hypothetical protein
MHHEAYSFLCCHPQFPGAMVDAAAGAGVTAGGFVAVPIRACGRIGPRFRVGEAPWAAALT